MRLVDVGRQDLDLHAPTLVEVDRHLVLVVLDGREERGHVLGRVVGLEVGRPVGDDAVGGGVRLVEGVVGEREQDLPELVDRDLGEAALEHAGLEAGVLLVELLLLLLAHRAAEVVGGAQGEAGEHLGDRHHLLLVDDQAVGLPQHRLERLGERGVDRLDRLAAVLAAGVLVVGVGTHRTGAVERADGGDVGEDVGLQGAQQRAHARAVELEDAERVAAAHQLVGRPVVEGQLLQHDRLVAVDLDVGQRVLEDPEVGQAEEVHLDESERLAHRVVELGDDGAVLRPRHDRVRRR